MHLGPLELLVDTPVLVGCFKADADIAREKEKVDAVAMTPVECLRHCIGNQWRFAGEWTD